MQLDNLYPTSGTTEYNFGITAALMNMPDSLGLKEDMGRQYLIGYCDSEHMPGCCLPVYFNQTSTDLTFLADYSQNYGFGFARWGYTGGAAPGNLYYIDDNDTLTRAWGVDYDFSFINSGEMCRVNTDPGVEVYIEGLYIRKDMYDGDKCTRLLQGGQESGGIEGLNGEWLRYTFSDFVNMIKNDTPLLDGVYRGRGGSAGQTFNITVRPSDFGDSRDPSARHYVALDDANDNFYAFITIGGFRMGGNTPVYYQNQQYAANIVPFFRIPHDTGKASMIMPGSYMRNSIVFSYSNGAFTGLDRGRYGYNQATDFVNNVIYGAFNNGTLSVNAVNWGEASTYGRGSFFIGNFYGGFLSSGRFYFYPQYTPRDIYNYLCLYHKHTSVPSDNYSSDDTVTVFNSTESPTFDTVSGTFSEIAAHLRLWQMPGVDISTNNFTPEDIPTPEPEEGEESGDKIDFIKRSFSGASNFITNYAMSRHQVGIFGNRLWTSWVDSLGNPTEMIKNIRIFYTGGDTGSIDIGSVMPFIVSMKIFPFDLSNFIGYETNGIKIGTGHYPINVPGCWYLPRSSVYVSCGTVTIPRIFNDFRDYENMNIMCYVPYCGTVELNPGDVIGRTLSCTYGVDLQSGGCTAYIIVDNNYPVATISGQMGSSVPLTATNSGQLMSQRLSDISGASALIGNTTMQVQRESERPHPKQANMDSAIVGAVLQAADSIPQRFRRSAISCPTMSAGNGLDAFAQPPTPYIQMRYGIYDLPANYKHSIGRISTKSNRLSEYKDTGFITCSNVDTSPLTCHNDEKAAIKAALESGVYI